MSQCDQTSSLMEGPGPETHMLTRSLLENLNTERSPEWLQRAIRSESGRNGHQWWAQRRSEVSGGKLLSFLCLAALRVLIKSSSSSPSAALVFAYFSLSSSPWTTKTTLRLWSRFRKLSLYLATDLSSLTVSWVPGTDMDCTQTRSGSWCQGHVYHPGTWEEERKVGISENSKRQTKPWTCSFQYYLYKTL